MMTASSRPSHPTEALDPPHLGTTSRVIPYQVIVALSVAFFLVPSQCAALTPFPQIHDGGARRSTTKSATIQQDSLVRAPKPPPPPPPPLLLPPPLTLLHASPMNRAAQSSRRHWMWQTTVAVWMTPLLLVAPTVPPPSVAAEAEERDPAASPPSPPVADLTDEQLRQIVTSDVIDNQFLVTGNLTPAAYLPSATFTDEIDTYGYQQWREGTQKLFVSEGSDVRLVGDVKVTPETVEFRFDEDLMFRIPFRPVVSLSGRVVLTRDPSTGKIASYREYWDQDVATVLKSAKVKLF